MAGWVAGLLENKANLNSTQVLVKVKVWAELGNNVSFKCGQHAQLGDHCWVCMEVSLVGQAFANSFSC